MSTIRLTGVGVVHGLGDRDTLLGMWRAGATPALDAATAGLPDPDVSGLAALLPGASLRRVPRYARMALLAAATALRGQNIDPERVAVVVGSAYSGVTMSMDFMDSVLDNGPHLSSPTAFSHAINNMGAGLLSLTLGLRGPCCTVTQFGLSFAGALEVAATLLHAGRADLVLVGAVDECDPRFTHTCPEAERDPRFTHTCPEAETACAAPAQGAVFFTIAHNGDGPELHASWSLATEAGQVFASGAVAEGQKHTALYGVTPLAHALDVALASTLCREIGPIACRCREANSGREVTITVSPGCNVRS